MNNYRLSLVLMVAVALLAVAPLLAAALAEPRVTVMTYDDFTRRF